jgi:hypothetical protein
MERQLSEVLVALDEEVEGAELDLLPECRR